jgi:hypothetical protein
LTAEPLPPVRMLWGFLCDYFMVDVSGKQSYIGVFEQIAARSFPADHKAMYVVCALGGPPGVETHGLLTIWSPQQTIVLSTPEIAVQFNAAGRALVVNLLYDVRLEQPGRYSAALELNRRQVGEVPLEVVAVAASQ